MSSHPPHPRITYSRKRRLPVDFYTDEKDVPVPDGNGDKDEALSRREENCGRSRYLATPPTSSLTSTPETDTETEKEKRKVLANCDGNHGVCAISPSSFRDQKKTGRENTFKTVAISSAALHEPPRMTLQSSNKQRQQHTASPHPRPRPRPHNLTQTTIDLGGTPYRQCKTCGMSYITTNAEDRALHKRYHDQCLNGLEVPKGALNGAGKVWSGLARSRVTKTNGKVAGLGKLGKGMARGRGRGRGREDAGGGFAEVVEVGRESGLAAKRFAVKVLRVVEKELGAVEMGEEMVWSEVEVGLKNGRRRYGKNEAHPIPKPTDSADRDSALTAAPPPSVHSFTSTDPPAAPSLQEIIAAKAARYKIYLYIQGRNCTGLLLAERIHSTHRIITLQSTRRSTTRSITPSTATASPMSTQPQTTSASSAAAPPTPSLTLPCSPLPHQHDASLPSSSTGTIIPPPMTFPAILGISRIWVSRDHRRQGIATTLVETARKNFVSENEAARNETRREISKEEIAWSQLTEMGQGLAGAWWCNADGGGGGGGGKEERKDGWSVYDEEEYMQ